MFLGRLGKVKSRGWGREGERQTPRFAQTAGQKAESVPVGDRIQLARRGRFDYNPAARDVNANSRNPGGSMADDVLRIGIDLSCLVPHPLTGVGYAASNYVRALIERGGPLELRLFASSGRSAAHALEGFDGAAARRTAWWPTRLKTPMWTRLEWPPMERFTGPIDIAHGMFHLLPAARHAKRVVTVYDLTGLRFPETHTRRSTALHTAMLSHAARRADAIVTMSQSCRNDLVELLGAHPDRIHVVPGGVDLDEFSTPFDAGVRVRLGIPETYFIYLGTIEPRKNLVRLIEAYAVVRDRLGEIPPLVIAGRPGWKTEAFDEAIERLKLGPQLILVGYLPRAETVMLLRGAMACLYPSLYEGFGLPALEAMAAGVPLLTSNVSSLPEVVGDTALMVEPESVESIAAGIEELLAKPEAARVRAERARARAETFTWGHSADILAAAYRNIAG